MSLDHEKAGGKTRLPALPSLTGLRFLAAFAVFLMHSTIFVQLFPFDSTSGAKTLSQVFPIQLGAGGVAFFFMLSGFIIDWSYHRAKGSIRAFYRRRVLKIYPSHLITAVAVGLIMAIPVATLVTMWPNFLLIHTWNNAWGMKDGLNGPSWSLCAEMLFYLSFPLLVPLVNRIRGNAIWWSIGILTLVLFALHLTLQLTLDNTSMSDMMSMYPHMTKSPDISWQTYGSMSAMSGHAPGMTATWLSYQFPPSRLLEFFIGVLVCRLVKSGMWRVTNLTWPLLACVAAYVLTYFVPATYRTSMTMMLPLAALIATFAVRDLDGRKGVLSSKVGVWLGNVSFAFYMVGYPTQLLLQRTVIRGHSWGFGGYVFITVLTLIIQLPLAAALYHLVDKPIMTKWARKKPKTPPLQLVPEPPAPTVLIPAAMAEKDPS